MTAAPPLDWIREIERALVTLDEKPQFGNAPSLDWSQLQEQLRRLFHKPNLVLSHQEQGWMASHQIVGSLGKMAMPLAIGWSQLSSQLYFVTDGMDLRNWIAELFSSEAVAQYFYDTSLVQGFYDYFASEMLRQLTLLHFGAPLTTRIGPEVTDLRHAIGEESCFVIDLSLSEHGKQFTGRLLLPSSFRDEWKRYFAHLPPPSLSDEQKQKLNVELGLEVARSRLSLEEWNGVKLGDFIILDRCSYNPVEHKGSVLLNLNQKHLFRGRIKDGGIKITNYPLYEEIGTMMDEKPFNRGHEEESDNLYGDLEQGEISEFDEDEDLFAGLEEESAPEEKLEAVREREEAKPLSLVAEQIPVNLTVEVGRIQMTAAELMKLTPGNLLDLSVSPEQGVDLVVNGKRVGKGELVRVGDLLGVRVLSLWSL